MVQNPIPPTHICFYCHKITAEGGSTPILRSDFVYDWLLENYPEFLKEVEEKGVKYIRIAPESDDSSLGFGKSWKKTYGVETKEEAQKIAASNGYTAEFIEGNACKITSKVLPAVKVASDGTKIFYN